MLDIDYLWLISIELLSCASRCDYQMRDTVSADGALIQRDIVQ